MSRQVLSALPLIFSLLVGASGCVVNRAISANAVADNHSVEKAQNEVLLLNVLRAREHLPMYLTSISKITGSIKAEAAINPTVPFGSVTGGGPTGVEAGTRAHYMAAATATYNWNPSFDVNVLDTSEFMRGFLSPVTSDTLAYYSSEDYPLELLFHLMVQKIQIRLKHDACNTPPEASPYWSVDEYTFHNHPDSLNPELPELNAFTELVDKLVDENPYFASGKDDPLEPELTKEEALEAKSLVEALKAGYVLTKKSAKDSDTKKTADAKTDLFRLQRTTSPKILMLDPGSLRPIYAWLQKLPSLGDSRSNEQKKLGFESNLRKELYDKETPLPKECLHPADSKGSASKGGATQLVQSSSSAEGIKASGLVKEPCDKWAQLTITFTLRSPEAILYYLGELARVEKDLGKAYCVRVAKYPKDRFAPIFVIRDAGCKDRVVEAVASDGKSYFIPSREPKGSSLCGESGEVIEIKEHEPFCDPGVSTTALSLVSQLIALQKSAKDLPTTSVVRVVGQ
jgi:hypothetical protein